MIIRGEQASEIQDLPISWRNFVNTHTGLSDSSKKRYLEMAQIFNYKFSYGDLDLFNKRRDLNLYKTCFVKTFAVLCQETLDFYAQDFLLSNYPNFDSLYDTIVFNCYYTNTQQLDNIEKILFFVKALFDEFEYQLPASFYWTYLSAIDFEDGCALLPLYFNNKKDRLRLAILFGQKASPIHMKIQSLSLKYGFVWISSFNYGLSRICQKIRPFEFSLDESMKASWIEDYIWNIWFEYMSSEISN